MSWDSLPILGAPTGTLDVPWVVLALQMFLPLQMAGAGVEGVPRLSHYSAQAAWPIPVPAVHLSVLNGDTFEKSLWGRQGDQQGPQPPSQLLNDRKHKFLSPNFRESHTQGNLSM